MQSRQSGTKARSSSLEICLVHNLAQYMSDWYVLWPTGWIGSILDIGCTLLVLYLPVFLAWKGTVTPAAIATSDCYLYY
jgi:hypothetical protein